MTTFAERLIELRKMGGLSQAELGEGVDLEQSEISRLESAKRPPSLEIMRKFAEFFDVSLDYMTGRVNKTSPVEQTRETSGEYRIQVGPSVMLPVLGTIRAGQPILMADHVVDYEPADLDTVRDGDYFYLLVKGDSMINDHITPGSLVLVRQQPEVNPNDIAVINVNGEEATLKRMRIVGDRAILIASNPAHDSQEYPASEIRVIGKVVEAKIKF